MPVRWAGVIFDNLVFEQEWHLIFDQRRALPRESELWPAQAGAACLSGELRL